MKVISLKDLQKKIGTILDDGQSVVAKLEFLLNDLQEEDIIIADVPITEEKPRKKKVKKDQSSKGFAPPPEVEKPKRGRKPKSFYKDEPEISEGDPSLK